VCDYRGQNQYTGYCLARRHHRDRTDQQPYQIRSELVEHMAGRHHRGPDRPNRSHPQRVLYSPRAGRKLLRQQRSEPVEPVPNVAHLRPHVRNNFGWK
jgi:hypothetical protein